MEKNVLASFCYSVTKKKRLCHGYLSQITKPLFFDESFTFICQVIEKFCRISPESFAHYNRDIKTFVVLKHFWDC